MRQMKKGLKKRLNQPSGNIIGLGRIRLNCLDLEHLFVHSTIIYWKPGPDTVLDIEITAEKMTNNLLPQSLCSSE